MKVISAHIMLAVLGLSVTVSAFAGREIQESPELVSTLPSRTLLPDDPIGLLTVGVQSSEHETGVYIDSITGLWTTPQRDAFLFLDSLYHYEDDGQFVSSTGLAFRKLLPEAKVIVGGNVFWDAINSARDNDYNQFGVGLELLTRWADFRLNSYLPEDSRHVIDRGAERSRSRNFKHYEEALGGFDSEIGFLLPGFSRSPEVRLFAGFYHYGSSHGRDFTGFKARLEARLLPGVMLDAEYWDDAALMGGHWTAGVRISVPLSLYNVIKLRNPFEGAGEFFSSRPREFDERLGEMVIRAERIKTITSGER